MPMLMRPGGLVEALALIGDEYLSGVVPDFGEDGDLCRSSVFGGVGRGQQTVLVLGQPLILLGIDGQQNP